MQENEKEDCEACRKKRQAALLTGVFGGLLVGGAVAYLVVSRASR